MVGGGGISGVKFTNYFHFRRVSDDRIAIQDAWILEIIKNLSKRITQCDGRIRL